jgi:hypothetical protein
MVLSRYMHRHAYYKTKVSTCLPRSCPPSLPDDFHLCPATAWSDGSRTRLLWRLSASARLAVTATTLSGPNAALATCKSSWRRSSAFQTTVVRNHLGMPSSTMKLFAANRIGRVGLVSDDSHKQGLVRDD